MASLTSAINVQVNSKDKERATAILSDLGVSMSALINMTLKQVIINNGIPFEVKKLKEENELHKYFNEEELDETAKELIYIEKNPKKYPKNNSINELFEALDSDD